MHKSHPQVLLIDDNKPLREVMSIMLKDEGYDVVEMGNGKLAFDHLLDCHKKSYPTCIVLDVMMPVMNGEEFMKKINESAEPSLREIPVVVYSAEGKIRNYPQIKARLEKPISIELLFSAIKGCL